MANETCEKSSNWLLVVVTIFMLSYFLINDLEIRYIYAYLLLGLFFILGMLCSIGINLFRKGGVLAFRVLVRKVLSIWKAERFAAIKRMKNISFSRMQKMVLFMVLPMALFSILPNANKEHETTAVVISMLVFTVYVLFAKSNAEQIGHLFVAVQIVAAVFAVYIIIVELWPNLYWEYVYPWLGSYTQQRAELLLPQGYGVPIGGSTSYSIYVMTIALMINVARLLVKGGIKDRKGFLRSLGFSALYLLAILLVNRRSEMLSIAISLVLVFIIYLNHRDKADFKYKMCLLVAVLFVGVILLSILTQMGLLDRYIATLEAVLSGDATVNDISNKRYVLWVRAWELFLQKPFFGVGWEQFRVLGNAGEDYVHNTYLQWLSESGVVGFVLIVTPLLFILISTLKQARRLVKTGGFVSYRLKEMNFVALGMLLFFLILNLMDPTFYHLYFFCFFSFSIILEDTALKLELDSKGANTDVE